MGFKDYGLSHDLLQRTKYFQHIQMPENGTNPFEDGLFAALRENLPKDGYTWESIIVTISSFYDNQVTLKAIPAQHFEDVVKRVQEAMPGIEATRLFSMANRVIAEACLVEIANYRSGKLKISVPP